MRFSILALLGVILSLAAGNPAGAEADGPDYWNVTGIAPTDVLNMRAEPRAAGRVVGRIPHSAKGLKNLGCRGTPSFQQWQRMTDAEKERSRRSRWCRVEYMSRTGWVAGRFLTEGGPPQ